MSINLGESVKQFTDLLKSEAKTENVIGQSFQLGEFTCVPVIKIGMGLGYGGGEGNGDSMGKGKGEGTAGGAGGGLGVEPVGFLTTRGDQISFISTNSSRGISSLFDKVPDLLEKMGTKQKSSKPEMAIS